MSRWGVGSWLATLACTAAAGSASVAESAAWPAMLGDAPEAPPAPHRTSARRAIGLAGTPTNPLVVDTSQREDVRRFYNTVYQASEGAVANWTGTRATCDAGAIDRSFQDSVALRINYYRAMAGLPAGITFDDGYSAKAQQTALMMSVNGTLSHFPAENWQCYSAAGAEGARNGNLALGQYGPAAITGYMQDDGASNYGVGHRRWLLYPQTRVMGTGDVPFSEGATAANSIWVFDDNFDSPRPPTRDEFVSWPPPGFVPYQLVFTRWSFSLPGADFNAAAVNVTSNGIPIPVVLEKFKVGVGEESVVWYAQGLDGSRTPPASAPASDVAYNVTVSGVVVAGENRNFSYVVKVIDPWVPGPDSTTMVPTGSTKPSVGNANTYALPTVAGASSYEWRQGTNAPLVGVIEGAETGLGAFFENATPGYERRILRTQWSKNNRYCLHLAHPEPATDQSLTYLRTVLPGPNAKLLFNSRLGYATPSQVAQVEVSLDEGRLWHPIYAQAGDDAAGELSFVVRQVPLSEFSGRTVQLRFNYHYAGGLYFTNTTDNVGWLIDDVNFQDCEEFKAPAPASTTGGSTFNYSPTSTKGTLLQARALVWGGIPTEWGPVLRVTPTTIAPPMVTLGRPVLVAGQLQVNFSVTGYRPGLTFRLLKLGTVDGVGTPELSALLETVAAGGSFRFKLQPPIDRAFYRVTVVE